MVSTFGLNTMFSIFVTKRAFLLTKRANLFNFRHLFFIIHVFADAGAKKRPSGFDIKLLKIFYFPCDSFHFFNMTDFSDFFL